MPSREPTRRPGVRALCSQLGYNDQDKKSTRYFTYLATTVRNFRSENMAYDVPRCALEFCEQDEKNKLLFTGSRDARKNGWPVLPNDKDRYHAPLFPFPAYYFSDDSPSIIETITRLIYVQESNSQETKRTTTTRKFLSGLRDDKPSEPKDYPGDYNRGSLESTTNVETSNNTLVRIKREENELAEEVGLGEPQREDEIEENAQSKTKEHLIWAYPEGQELKDEYLPCDIRKDAFAAGYARLTWLFRADPNEHWPDEPRSHVWRYMHDNNIYSLAPEFDEMQDLTNDLICFLRITCNGGQFSAIFDKLKHFVALWTRTWLDWGMLQTDKDFAILRSNEFESQLKARQTIWLAQKETISQSPSKRAGEPVRGPFSNKRQRTNVQSIRTGNSNHNGECVSISRESSTEEVIVLGVPPNRKIPAINNAVAAKRARVVSTEEVARHSEENSIGSPTNHIVKPGPIPPPPVSESYDLSSFSIEGLIPLESPPQSTDTTSSVVNQSASSNNQITSTRTLQEPLKIKLFLQKTDGEIDSQNPLLSGEFRDATLIEFFAIFSNRSGLDAGLLQSITFVVVFAQKRLLEANRNDDERSWENLKRRISRLFEEAKAERPQETEFEVWVVEDNDLAGL